MKQSSFNTISVVGLGYIGLPTAAMFAAYGKQVIGIDVRQDVVNTINRGEIHIVEPELDVMVRGVVNEGRLLASIVPEPADAFLIAVPTPFFPCNENNFPEPNLEYVEKATKSIAKVLKRGDLVILESTSPVGATEKVAEWLTDARPDLVFPNTKNSDRTPDVNIAHCPERVLPGQVVRELVENDRVIGGMSPECSERAVSLYKSFVKGECVITNARTAEMAKLTENSYRDVNIAFANELSLICDELDIDVWELIRLANRHPRVNILQPGPGVGGHCIAVDPWFIVSRTPQLAKLIHTARQVNDYKPQWVANKVKIAIAEFLSENPNLSASNVSIACLGLAFKANIDDLRESPALQITQQISEFHAGDLLVVEPNIDQLPETLDKHMTLVNLNAAMEASNIVVVLVDHKEFIGMEVPYTHKLIDTKGIVQKVFHVNN
ncbi:MAG: UDP-N-acetyl-D-mannosamine dehydrogenase [Aestuariibacter sp.]